MNEKTRKILIDRAMSWYSHRNISRADFKSAHNGRFITDDVFEYGLNPRDYDDMKIGEIKEVFLNLED